MFKLKRFVALACALVWSAQIAAGAEDTALCNAVIKAYGGPSGLAMLRDAPWRCQAQITAISSISGVPNTFACEILKKGSRLRTEMTVLGQSQVTGFDGKSAWVQEGDWVAPASPAQSRHKADEIRHGLLALNNLGEPGWRVELLSVSTRPGKLCDVFRLVPADGLATTLYVDPSSGLVVRGEYTGTDDETGQRSVIARDYEDYRLAGGVMQPFRTTEYSNDRKVAEIKFTSIEPDPGLEDSVFRAPPETEFARLHEGPVTIPFEYDGNQVVIKARLNSGAEARFIVDAGATQSLVDRQMAASLGHESSDTLAVTTGSAAMALRYAKVATLQMGELTISDVPVLITDLSAFGADSGEHVSGLIGANVLRRFLVTIDWEERKLVLGDPRSVAIAGGASVLRATPVSGGGQMMVTGRVDGKRELNFLVDTGAAFNTLPPALARELSPAVLLPVGELKGLDGRNFASGAIRVKSLSLSGLAITNPVFAVVINKPGAAGRAPGGLLSARTMGILGNPVWSQFRTTIDYRHERLILDVPPHRTGFLQYTSRLEQLDRRVRSGKDNQQVVSELEKIEAHALVDGQEAAAALAAARLAGCYADRFTHTGQARWQELAGREYERAGKLAAASYNRSVEGQVAAQWALFYLNTPRSQSDVSTALRLLNGALDRSPMEPCIYAALGTAMLGRHKFAEARTLLNRALMLDPSNWQALWGRYNIARDEHRARDGELVLAQLVRYWGSSPEVMTAAIKVTGRHVNVRPAPARRKGRLEAARQGR